MHYLLDTNIIIALSKSHLGLEERLSNIPSSAILLSSIVVAEIEYGIAKSAKKAHNRLVFDRLLKGFEIVAFDGESANYYGPIRATLESRGEVIGPHDMLIAAQAMALDAVVVTDNIDEFSRVEGLVVENWLRS